MPDPSLKALSVGRDTGDGKIRDLDPVSVGFAVSLNTIPG
jgi:hypothetical protein